MVHVTRILLYLPSWWSSGVLSPSICSINMAAPLVTSVSLSLKHQMWTPSLSLLAVLLRLPPLSRILWPTQVIIYWVPSPLPFRVSLGLLDLMWVRCRWRKGCRCGDSIWKRLIPNSFYLLPLTELSFFSLFFISTTDFEKLVSLSYSSLLSISLPFF